MKRITVNILDTYKSYKKDTIYELYGDLIIISGVNGSGKSQLLKVIANSGKESIKRIITQISED